MTSHTDHICELLGLQLSTAQRRACRYLERHGQRFLVDFGYINAIDLARDHWRARRRQQRRRR